MNWALRTDKDARAAQTHQCRWPGCRVEISSKESFCEACKPRRKDLNERIQPHKLANKRRNEAL